MGVFRNPVASVLVGSALLGVALGSHPCETEVASACPESPASELAGCLKDSKQHEKPTEISSGCTDFMALNKACAEEIEQLCDENFFSEETIPCLAKWRGGDEEFSEKCTSVMSWAMPVEAEEAETVTDELGMSEADYEEKKEWQAKRKAARGDAIERMKMKDVDAKKEQERVELERYKSENPEEYAAMIAQQEEEKRQQADFKRRERQMAAALQRKKRAAAGETEEAPQEGGKLLHRLKDLGVGYKKSGWMPSVTNLVALVVLGGIGYVVLLGAGVIKTEGGSNPRRGGGGGGKKKRG
ncbi:unnamed protein product [Polarella glacialis]|uniref:Uncharacterized protein n=1 Tax=Polarella glacialis TaxID=89957 RepID=A0A813HE87_POLGL|nr:unnamed protein product [Polarella glacialis]|eukprot:CAMPEP_0115124728 /NCGR_PEP_ID=MMETSP0227-20121206/48528_1 /TAXON_ID=89957 /ORGANISM="Polarella glacialis, Strain CCMP 1383" /LENGTH=298 /DNA_ID=CAMNT_0002527781 /DNA_START=42 /DNA_END=938 /DNA_ORIENTATION=+